MFYGKCSVEKYQAHESWDIYFLPYNKYGRFF